MQKLMEMFEKERKSNGNVQQLLLLPVRIAGTFSVATGNPDRSHKLVDYHVSFAKGNGNDSFFVFSLIFDKY